MKNRLNRMAMKRTMCFLVWAFVLFCLFMGYWISSYIFPSDKTLATRSTIAKLVRSKSELQKKDGESIIKNAQHKNDIERENIKLPPRFRNKLRVGWATLVLNANSELLNRAVVLFMSLNQVQTIGEKLLLHSQLTAELEQTYAGTFRHLDVLLVSIDESVVKFEEITSKTYRDILEKSGKMWEYAKLRLFEMEEYDRLVFLDCDMMFRANADELLTLPHGSHSDGPVSPFNGGLWIIKPNKKEFEYLKQLIKDGNFTYETGWNNAGLLKSIKNYASESLQGLLFYYFDIKLKSGVRLDRKIYNYQDTELNNEQIKIIHFTVCRKPNVMRQVDDGVCKKFHEEWLELYHQKDFLSF